MSWVMPIDDMLKKIYSGAHTKYHHLGKREILEKAIEDKKYIFDLKRPFKIIELDIKGWGVCVMGCLGVPGQ